MALIASMTGEEDIRIQYAHPAEDVSAVIDLTEGGYGAGCKEQWMGLDIDPTKAHPALINRIDLLGSHECSCVKLY